MLGNMFSTVMTESMTGGITQVRGEANPAMRVVKQSAALRNSVDYVMSESEVVVVYDKGLWGRVETLERQVSVLAEALEERIDRFEDVLVSLEIAVVDGYFVKIWADVDSDEWIAECPVVRCAVQKGSAEEARAAIADTIPEMLAMLKELGRDAPPRDIG